MSNIPCPVSWCDRPRPGSSQVCGACSQELVRDLADVPSLAHHLDLALTRQSRMGGGDGGRRDAETPLPWDERAREAGFVLRSSLVGWVRLLSEHVRSIEGPMCGHECGHPTCEYIDLTRGPVDDLAAIARWLIRHVKVLLLHEAAGEAAEEILDAVRQARRAVDRPPDRLYAGPCDQCGADMYARLGAAVVACPVCVGEDGRRPRYQVRERRAGLLAEAAELLLPAPDVARALTSLVRPIAPALLHTWVARGKLVPRSVDARGRSLFKVSDVMDLLLPSGLRVSAGGDMMRET